MRLSIGMLLAAGMAAPAWAEDAETARLRELAAKEKQEEAASLPARVSTLEKKAEKADSRISLKDGLKFQSDDGNFTAHVGGRFLAHYRWFDERPDSTRTSPDTFYIRQAKLETSGTFMKQFEYKVQANWATGDPNASAWGRARLDDGYLGWNRYKEVSLRVGQFKEPFSQEELCSTRFIDFDERSNVNRLVPGRDVGLMLYGDISNKILEYSLAFYNGGGQNANDNNDEKDLALQLRTTPFASMDMDFLKGLRIGIAATWGDLDNVALSATSYDLVSTELAVNWLDCGAVGSLDGLRTRMGAELSYLYGPMSFRAEYVKRVDKVDVGAAFDGEKIPFTGWYVSGTYLLTGEKKALENRVKPDNPFDIDAGGFGAVELAVRYHQVKVGDEIFTTGIAAAANADKISVITVGVNWWLWNNFRFSPNFIFEKYSEEILSGRHVDPTDKAMGMLFRFQVDF
jgi:phosphate-selective porin OprO/OprP